MYQPPPIDAADGAYRERPFVPSRTALLSVDMQNIEFNAELLAQSRIKGTPQSKKRELYERLADIVIPNQVRLQKAAREAGIEVIYTVIESLTLDGRDRSLDHKISGIHNPKGAWEAQVIPEVAPLPGEILIPKTSSGVFNSTNIEYVLRNLNIEYLLIYGVVTDQCVESAIRDAADRGFMVTEVEDCCAADTPDNHTTSIASMGGHYCRVRTTDQVISEMSGLKREKSRA